MARVVVHADEACLGNGRDGATPGGAGGLVEAVRPRSGAIERFDYFLSEPDTTNNRMAIRSAVAALELIGARGKFPAVLFVSDSEYLVRGMTSYLSSWVRRSWKNVKNPDLWQRLVAVAEPFGGRIEWQWVRGHNKHVKNEYADLLATRAAKEQQRSGGLVASGFVDWLAAMRAKGKYEGYDPDEELHT